MSSRILIPLMAAAALAAPVAAQAEQGDWLLRVGVSALFPDAENLNTGNAFLVADSDLKRTKVDESAMLTDPRARLGADGVYAEVPR